ncbi:MAG: hypothetical protein AMJ79_00120 [Phycisphaerae bacterium SM23_30]|nr:MAG: hypothetical protein AMJ79_00120 [Phycisphaerae bacterium SM23_30]
MSKHKRASIYILTLASAMVLVSLVLGLSYLVMQSRRSLRTNAEIDRARVYAELGIYHALHFTAVEPNWRQLLPSGIWLQDVTVDQATYSVSGIDPVDGNLANNQVDPVDLICTAAVNGAQHTLQVQAQNAPSELLKYALAAGGLIDINNHARIEGDVFTNSNIDKSGGDTWVFGDAEAVGSIHETANITGEITPGAAAKNFPDDQVLVNYYLNHATPIPFINQIQEVLISPISNPLGPINPEGLYIINCTSQKIVIRNCRIVGTLVLVNPKSDSEIKDAINWQPALADYPALVVVDGAVKIQPNMDLDENNLKVDFNLPGEDGQGENYQTFPNLIFGPIYCRGNLELGNSVNVQGPVISTGFLVLKDYAKVTIVPNYYHHPPKYYRETYLAPIRGTWK